ncbi:hypothetical protein BDP81DRAFT_4881 [Colletotrichum phormii]|uniref:Uncharacterized protein n=1 Tax=Colletotrichum phormii TaxID=359342 RepID=A0AAJ0A2Z9_9PEZI|nr:uncharacterized protein BDP81DRAFT_4881 [Colletotrichum phormii]KAK1655491.1 hypothetical protein BDP81DRAFT_4881 [Colletotrichum phormii]
MGGSFVKAATQSPGAALPLSATCSTLLPSPPPTHLTTSRPFAHPQVGLGLQLLSDIETWPAGQIAAANETPRRQRALTAHCACHSHSSPSSPLLHPKSTTSHLPVTFPTFDLTTHRRPLPSSLPSAQDFCQFHLAPTIPESSELSSFDSTFLLFSQSSPTT